MLPVIINPKSYNRALSKYLQRLGDGEWFVFAYGSLIWQPGFTPVESLPARLYGYTRRLSVRSMHYRGDEKFPGLVFGLAPGGSCNGMLLRAPRCRKKRILSDLFRREMFAEVYTPKMVNVYLLNARGNVMAKRRAIPALTFVVRQTHALYQPPMPIDKACRIIAKAKGYGGKNADYIYQTRQILNDHQIHCPQLSQLCKRLTMRAAKT